MIRWFNTSLQTVRVAGSALALCLVAGSALAQNVAAHVQPASQTPVAMALKNARLAPVAPTLVELGAWVQPKAAAVDNNDGVRIGAPRASSATGTVAATQAALRWQATAGGGQVAALSFVSNEAFGLRVGLLVQALPANAIVRVYAPDWRDQASETTGERIAQTLQNNAKAGDSSVAGRTWWTPAVDGDELTVEIELPAGVASSSVQVAAPQVVHIYENIFNLIDDGSHIEAKINNAAACTLDSTCYDGYAAQRDAVARMHYVTDQGAYLCTGTLLNDRAGSGKPYFMTANHCISTQTVASSLQTFWFYRTPSCNSRLLSSASKTLKGGAQLLYTSASPDASLLLLNDAAPAGAVFAGWDANPVAKGAAVVGIHHPRGDLQKISFGSIVGSSACTPGTGYYSCRASNEMNENFYRVQWSQGTTEGGSSGSALFVNGVVTGMLSNGSASCSNTGGTNNYSRFDKVFPAVKQWLYPEVAAPAAVDVFSFLNTATGAHFYTVSAEERDLVIAVLPSFRFEGVAFQAYQQAGAGLNAVYRFYNWQTGVHVYTANAQERSAMQANPGVFQDNGVAWYGK